MLASGPPHNAATCPALPHTHLPARPPCHPARPSPSLSGALEWVVDKEARDLEVLHGQSDLSSWYFIESAEIAGVRVNVTISLSSRLLSSASRGGMVQVRGGSGGGGWWWWWFGGPSSAGAAGAAGAASNQQPCVCHHTSGLDVLAGMVTTALPACPPPALAPPPSPLQTSATGYFNRVLGASGFQLVNVANVPISLGRWMVGTDPSLRTDPSSRGRFSNGFLSQKALKNNLIRHYTREALKEAHKVLGGAGPAVASVPLTMVWAGGSVVSLLRNVSTGSTGPVAAAQQVAYVPFMAMSMIVSSFSRMLAALLALIPPDRPGGDDEVVQRLIRRPANALEAAVEIPKELGRAVVAGASGLLLDPIAGWQAHQTPGAALGLIKGVFGLPARLGVGAIEATAGALQVGRHRRPWWLGCALSPPRRPIAIWGIIYEPYHSSGLLSTSMGPLCRLVSHPHYVRRWWRCPSWGGRASWARSSGASRPQGPLPTTALMPWRMAAPAGLAARRSSTPVPCWRPGSACCRSSSRRWRRTPCWTSSTSARRG